MKYCELDCKALYEVNFNLSLQFFNKFNIDTNTTPTLPSATLKTSKAKFYLKDIQIAKVSGRMYDNINNTFKVVTLICLFRLTPKNKQKQVFVYDVNFL